MTGESVIRQHLLQTMERKRFSTPTEVFMSFSRTLQQQGILVRLQVFLLRRPQNAHFFSAPYKVIEQFSAETMPNIDMLREKGCHRHNTRGMCRFFQADTSESTCEAGGRSGSQRDWVFQFSSGHHTLCVSDMKQIGSIWAVFSWAVVRPEPNIWPKIPN